MSAAAKNEFQYHDDWKFILKSEGNISPACVLMKSTAKSLYMSSIVSILAGCWTIVKFWKIGQPGE